MKVHIKTDDATNNTTIDSNNNEYKTTY